MLVKSLPMILDATHDKRMPAPGLIPNCAELVSCSRNKIFLQTALASGLRRLRYDQVCQLNKLDGVVLMADLFSKSNIM